MKKEQGKLYKGIISKKIIVCTETREYPYHFSGTCLIDKESEKNIGLHSDFWKAEDYELLEGSIAILKDKSDENNKNIFR